MKSRYKYGIIILAAGSSSRLGQPKQLLKYNNTTLINHVVTACQGVPNAITVVVTGAVHEEVKAAITATDIKVRYNPDWQQGMSTSIKCGLQELLNAEPDIKACILAVCDQPYISTSMFNALISAYENSNGEIIASSYSGTAGTPALFGNRFFTDLFALAGQEGAKKIIGKNETNVSFLPFHNGAIDIDTIADYVTLIAKHDKQ